MNNNYIRERHHPLFTSCSASIDPPDMPEIEPTAEDYSDAKDALEISDVLAEFLADEASYYAAILYRTSQRFRDAANVRFDGWIHAKAVQIAEKRIQRENAYQVD